MFTKNKNKSIFFGKNIFTTLKNAIFAPNLKQRSKINAKIKKTYCTTYPECADLSASDCRNVRFGVV